MFKAECRHIFTASNHHSPCVKPVEQLLPAPAETAGARRSRCSDSAGWSHRCSCANVRCWAAPGCSATAGQKGPRCGRKRCCQRRAGSRGGRSQPPGWGGAEEGRQLEEEPGTEPGSSGQPDGIEDSGKKGGNASLQLPAAAAGRWILLGPLRGPSGSVWGQSQMTPGASGPPYEAGRPGSRSCGRGQQWRPERRLACLQRSSGWRCCSFGSPEGPSWRRFCWHCGPERETKWMLTFFYLQQRQDIYMNLSTK